MPQTAAVTIKFPAPFHRTENHLIDRIDKRRASPVTKRGVSELLDRLTKTRVNKPRGGFSIVTNT